MLKRIFFSFVAFVSFLFLFGGFVCLLMCVDCVMFEGTKDVQMRLDMV